MSNSLPWYAVRDQEKILSPALLVYPDRIMENISLMTEIAGGPELLRPHVKTHKMAEIIRMQMAKGIRKFKCATITEAALLGECKADSILLAMQPTLSQINIFFNLIEKFNSSNFSTLVDNRETLQAISGMAAARKIEIGIWMDINNGMNRTGIEPGYEAELLYRSFFTERWVRPMGWHVYDGHIRISDPAERARACETALEPVLRMRKNLEREGISVPVLITGGTPSFPVHAKNRTYDLSPGTTLLWDEGYGSRFPDLSFLHAAVLATRIISKPAKGFLCLDLGHKSVASEMPLPRVRFLGDHHFEQVSQSEEHLVVSCPNPEDYSIGQLLYAIPLHICPTVAKYPEADVVEDHEVTGQWQVAARDHYLK